MSLEQRDSNMELEEQIQDAKVEGWSLHERTGKRAIMIRRRYGSLLSHIVIGLLSFLVFAGLGVPEAFFIGNILYLGYKYFLRPDKRVVRADG